MQSRKTGPGGIGKTDGTSSLKLWLDAAASSTITESSGSISAWNDKSGNSNHASQSTAAKKPTYQTNQINGNAAILFDESDDILAVSGSLITGTSDFHLIAAIKRGSLPSTPADAIMGNYDGNANELVMYVGGGAGTHANRLWYGGGNAAQGSTDVSNGTAAIFAGKRSSGNATVYTNSTSDGSGTNSTSIPSGSNWTIGNYTSSTSDAFKGHMAELIAFNVALKEAERILIDNYLSAKWNITLSGNDKYAGDNSGNGDYDMDVAGIGKEADGSNTVANSAGLVITDNGSLDANTEYLIAGHKTATNSIVTADVTPSVTHRWNRIWYLDKTGTLGGANVQIGFDFSDGGLGGTPATASNYRLLYRSGTSGNFSEVTTATSAIAGDNVNFTVTDANLGNGYYTIGTINNSSSPLPVQMSGLSADAHNLGAELKWNTATETNNYGFEIERSAFSGQLSAASWLKVGFVAGSGTSSSPREYSFVDRGLAPGRYAYRIKQIDHDGTFHYHGNAEVEIGLTEKRFVLESNYPNPFNPSTTIRFTLAEDAKTRLRVFNVLGEQVATLFDEVAQAGRLHEVTFDATRLPSGVYFSTLESGSQRVVKKMVLMK